MSKSINANTITPEAISLLSAYNQATLVLRNLAVEHKAKEEELKDKLAGIIEERQKALDAGKNIDTVAEEFSLVDAEKAITAEAIAYKAACEPWRAAQRNARKLVPKDIYESYTAAYEKGQVAAYEADVKNFLSSLGISVPTTAQLNKVARQFVVRTSGARRANQKAAEQGHYITAKSKVQYSDIFMLAILEWLVTDKKVLKVLPDSTLVRVEYPAK